MPICPCPHPSGATRIVTNFFLLFSTHIGNKYPFPFQSYSNPITIPFSSQIITQHNTTQHRHRHRHRPDTNTNRYTSTLAILPSRFPSFNSQLPSPQLYCIARTQPPAPAIGYEMCTGTSTRARMSPGRQHNTRHRYISERHKQNGNVNPERH